MEADALYFPVHPMRISVVFSAVSEKIAGSGLVYIYSF